jgi:putative Ig domain-containing protein/dockerin type I repeat protein
VQLTLDPAEVIPDNPTKLTWRVLNAFSLTAQQCTASIVGNPAGAGTTWSGLQKGTMVNGIYTGSATITPTANGKFTYALTCGGKESSFVTLDSKDNSQLQIIPPTVTKATVNEPFDLQLGAIGGIEPYKWSVVGTLPDGLTFVDGILSGTPLQFGEYSFVFEVDDSSPSPLHTTLSYTLNVASGLIMVPSLPNAQVGKPYAEALQTSGGLPPYTWKLTGKLPPGLQLNTSTGTITGTPTELGAFTFTITVSDSETTPAKDQEVIALTVAGPLVVNTTSPLPPASVGQPYTLTLAATGGTPPYTWTSTSGPNPPPGLSLATDGTASGTPKQYTVPEGAYNTVTVVVSDSSNPKLSTPATLAIAVQSTLKIAATVLPTGTVGVVTNVPLTATGGIPPYKWTVSALPNPDIGVSIVNGDMLQYLPTAAITSIVTLTVEDSENTPASDIVNLSLITMLQPLTTNTHGPHDSIKFSPNSQSVQLIASVTAASGTVNGGIVTFTVPGVAGSATSGPVTGGSASANFSVPGGTPAATYSIHAMYSGTTTFFSSSDSSGSLSIEKAAPIITWKNPASVPPGTILGSSQLNATASVPGTFVYHPLAGTVLTANPAQTLSVTFTPADSVDYNSATASVLISVTPRLGDVNGDGVVNCTDMAIVKASFGKKTGQIGFDPRADVNGDGVVNVLDLSTVARQLPAGTTCH